MGWDHRTTTSPPPASRRAPHLHASRHWFYPLGARRHIPNSTDRDHRHCLHGIGLRKRDGGDRIPIIVDLEPAACSRSAAPTNGANAFHAAAETMLTIAADPCHLGARLGITAVLHTWGGTHPPPPCAYDRAGRRHHPHISPPVR